jgi:hypothetical protein
LKYRYDDANADNETAKNAKLNSAAIGWKNLEKKIHILMFSQIEVLFNLLWEIFSYLKIARL